MTNALIATVVAAAATFLAAGLVIQFAVGGSQAAQEELRGGVKIDDANSMYQLIMYDSLIAYQCDDDAGGNLDGTGDNDWAPWSAYKAAANQKDSDDLTFQDLNESFRGKELGCYGTETSIGGKGIGNALNPASREWRNDQEGEHSRIRFTVNRSKNDGAIGLNECLWVDTKRNLGPAASAPDKGFRGITDMVYYMATNEEVNSHDYTMTHDDNSDVVTNGDVNCHQISVNADPDGLAGGEYHGNFLTVTWICEDSACGTNTYTQTHDSSSVGYPDEGDFMGDKAYANRIRGPDSWDQHDGSFEIRGYKLCPGARGYIQTNTGYTWSGDSDEPAYSEQNYMETPPYHADNMPGSGQKEKYSDQNDEEDNSVHPTIVIEDIGDTSNCGYP